MTELLKRGGIEFLAVFLGIALSLWVDQYQKSKDWNAKFNAKDEAWKLEKII